MNQARKDVLREDNGDFQMKVIGSVFSGAGKDGDFDWMITQDHYEDALFVFNDNEGQYKAHRDQPTDLAGAGWSVRPATRGQAWKRLETIYFLDLTLYCTRNRKGNFKVGMRTEKSRLRRSLTSLQELMRRIRHYAISDQAAEINSSRSRSKIGGNCDEYPDEARAWHMGQLRPKPARGDASPKIILPSPQKVGGMPLMEAISKRRSAREFAPKELPLPMLSNLLWATYVKVFGCRPFAEACRRAETGPAFENLQGRKQRVGRAPIRRTRYGDLRVASVCW
jgi:hypothetical protein